MQRVSTIFARAFSRTSHWQGLLGFRALGPLLLSPLAFGLLACAGDVHSSQTENGDAATPPNSAQGSTEFDTPVIPEPKPPAPDSVQFTPAPGTFIGQQQVSLSTGNSATIRYTLDGSVPNASSPIYAAPITLNDTTLIRAAAFANGDDAVSDFAAASYVALADDSKDFSSNLPVLILERHGDRPLDGSDEHRTMSFLVFEPDTAGRSELLGESTLMSRGSIHIRGETSAGFPQKGFTMELWHAGDDEDREEVVLGMPSESDWVLIAPSQMDFSLMRTMLPMDLSRRIGDYAPRMRFVEVFLVDRENSDRLERNDYVGVYAFGEKIKRGENRVNVAKAELPSEGGSDNGGFIFRIDHGENDFNSRGRDFQWVYPDPEEMHREERRPQADFLQNYMTEFLEAIAEDDFTNRNTGKHYSEYIDVPKFIDHNLLVALTKNVDGLRLSAYFHKDIDGKVAAGPIWDFDRSMGTHQDDRTIEPEEWGRGDGTQPLTEVFWGDLFRDPEFSAAYWKRWDELATTDFSVESITEMIDGYEEQLGEARERHFERWGEFSPQDGPAGEVQTLREWFARRVPWLSAQQP
jgi:CotH kinase protein/Chitobiase/beta-hexosaminidase C-terminal domain